MEKGKRNAQRHQKRPAPEQHASPSKRQKVQEPIKPVKKVELPKKEAPKGKSSAEAMQRLSKSNPGLYKLLKADNLIEGAGDDKNSDEFADDDRDIAYWEKKLGMNKKKVKTLGKEFEEDGLLEILGGIEGEEGDDDQEYLRKKRQRNAEKRRLNEMEGKAEEAVDDMFAGLDSDEENEDELSDGEEIEESMEEEDEEEIISEEDDEEIIDEDDIDSDEEALNEESEEEEVQEQPKASVLSKYVPPHLRKTAVTKSEQQMKLHKQLQGQLNRLSESNMESILLEIEKCYGIYPRHGKNVQYAY